MKNFKKWGAMVLASLLLFSTACRKEKAVTGVQLSDRIFKMENEDNVTKISYYTDGRIQRVGIYEKTGYALANYQYMYEQEKLIGIKNGHTTWKYSYEGNLPVKIEIENTFGKQVAEYVLSYDVDGKLTQQVNYYADRNGNKFPEGKASYHYNAAGNIIQTDLFDFTGKGWKKTGEIRTPLYDDKRNTISHLENYPYIPISNMLTNNPLVEEFINDAGEVVETILYKYDYDSEGRTLSRKTTHLSRYFPETENYTKIS